MTKPGFKYIILFPSYLTARLQACATTPTTVVGMAFLCKKCFYCKPYKGVGAIIYSTGTRKMNTYKSSVPSVVCFLGIIVFVFSQESGFCCCCCKMCTSYFSLGCDVILSLEPLILVFEV